jgi:hypothetical protein
MTVKSAQIVKLEDYIQARSHLKLDDVKDILGVTTPKVRNCPVREAAAMLARSAIRAEK